MLFSDENFSVDVAGKFLSFNISYTYFIVLVAIDEYCMYNKVRFGAYHIKITPKI